MAIESTVSRKVSVGAANTYVQPAGQRVHPCALENLNDAGTLPHAGGEARAIPCGHFQLVALDVYGIESLADGH